MYGALALVIIGNGFFKPNISTLLGNLYNREDLLPKKDVAYNIFYMGINIGAFICNFVAAYLRINYSWSYAFAAAGFGMLLSVVIFASGQKFIKSADVIKPAKKEDMPFSRIVTYVFLPAVLAGALGWFIPGNLFGSDSNDAFIFAVDPSGTEQPTFTQLKGNSNDVINEIKVDAIGNIFFAAIELESGDTAF